MASNASHHPSADQRAPTTAMSSPSWGTIIFSLAILTLVGITIGVFYMIIFHHPHLQRLGPLPPIITLQSLIATTLSNTKSASWNLTFSLSNPNPKSFLFYDHFTVGVYYTNWNHVFLGDQDLGNFSQPENGYSLFLPNISFSVRNLGEQDVKKFLDDQEKGSVGIAIKDSFLMSFEKDKNQKIKNVYSVGLTLYFEPIHEKIVVGIALPVPRDGRTPGF